MEEPIQKISKSLINIDGKILELIYKDLAQPSVQKVGKALSTVLGLGNTFLLPIKLTNEKANIWFSMHMENYKRQLEKVEESKIIEVQPEIGVPILEKLEYTKNEKLGKLYVNLLANASNIDTVGKTHPSFVNIIGNLSPDEAKILEYFDEHEHVQKQIPHLTMRLRYKFNIPDFPLKEGMIDSNEYYTEFENSELLMLPEKSKMYFENLIGLGLVQRVTDKASQEHRYDELMKNLNEEIERERNNLHVNKIEFIRGYYILTLFGKEFIRACKESKENKGENDA